MAFRNSFGLIAAVTIGLAATAAFAHEARPKGKLSPAVKAAWDRHDNFEKMGGAFKRLSDELRKDRPDVTVVQAQTKTISTLSTALPTWFPKGSGAQARLTTEAKANIWTDTAGFTAAASTFQVQASKLNQLAAAGDIAGVKGQFRATGGACKGCHDKFREEKK